VKTIEFRPKQQFQQSKNLANLLNRYNLLYKFSNLSYVNFTLSSITQLINCTTSSYLAGTTL
jgi:hypothetical protein